MGQFVQYDATTGNIIGTGSMPDADLNNLISQGVAIIKGTASWQTDKIDLTTMQVVKKTTSPQTVLSVSDLRQYLTQKRLLVEGQGIVLNGINVYSDVASQNRIASAIQLYSATEKDPTVADISFKSMSGFYTISLNQMIQIGIAVGNHIQQCFSAEKTIYNQIDAGTITTTAQIDSSTAWPASVINPPLDTSANTFTAPPTSFPGT